MAKVIWYGDEVSAAVKLASRRAIDDTTRQAAGEARVEHWWRGHPSKDGKPSNLESNTVSERGTSMYEPAQAFRDGAAGRFGTTRRQGFYGYFLERRQPFLRPIGDRLFPRLPERLRERFGAQ